MNAVDNVYRICVTWHRLGVQLVWNFPTVGNMRTAGYLDNGRVYSDINKAFRYIYKYTRHYPKKDIVWRVEVMPSVRLQANVA